MKRRTALQGVGSTGVALFLAGCSDDVASSRNETEGSATAPQTSSDTITAADEGPPFFEDVSISVDSAPVGEEIVATVSAANTGGSAGDFTAELTIAPVDGYGESSISVRINEVEAGKRESTQVSLGASDAAATWRARLPEHDAADQFRTTPIEASFGERLTTANASATVSNPRAAVVTTDDRGRLAGPGDGNVWIVVDTQSAVSESLTSPTFTVSEAADVEVPFGAFPDDAVARAVPTEDLTDGLTVEADVAFGDKAELRWTTDSFDYPETRLVDASLPEELPSGFASEISITVENVGTAPANYRAHVLRPDRTGSDPTSLTATVPPGETAQATGEITVNGFEDHSLVLRTPSDEIGPRAVRGVPKELAPGETFRLDYGLLTTVEETVGPFDSFDWSIPRLNEAGTTDAGAGRTFYAARIRQHNDKDESLSGLHREDISLRTDNESWTPPLWRLPGGSAIVDFDAPFSGPQFTGLWIDSGGTVRSWVLFRVPDTISSPTLRIRNTGLTAGQRAGEWSFGSS